MLSNWDLIVATCNWNGSCNRILSTTARRNVWTAADGFGKMTADQLDDLGVMEDWSHLRDSSDEGKTCAANQIRAELAKMDVARTNALGDCAFQTHEETVEETVAKLGLQNEVAR